jgi:hypothetical protein
MRHPGPFWPVRAPQTGLHAAGCAILGRSGLSEPRRQDYTRQDAPSWAVLACPSPADRTTRGRMRHPGPFWPPRRPRRGQRAAGCAILGRSGRPDGPGEDNAGQDAPSWAVLAAPTAPERTTQGRMRHPGPFWPVRAPQTGQCAAGCAILGRSGLSEPRRQDNARQDAPSWAVLAAPTAPERTTRGRMRHPGPFWPPRRPRRGQRAAGCAILGRSGLRSVSVHLPKRAPVRPWTWS